MIDLTEKFTLRIIKQESEYGSYGVGVMVLRSQDGEVVGRQACVVANEDCGMELADLTFPATGSILDAANAVKSFLMDHRVKPGARTALLALEEALRRGDLVMGSDVLVGHECNA